MKDGVLLMMRQYMKAALKQTYWDGGLVETLTMYNGCARVAQDSVDAYLALHQHLREVAASQGWDVARKSLEHWTKRLRLGRATATCRLAALVRCYTILRDGQKAGFTNERLQESNVRALRAEIRCLQARKDAAQYIWNTSKKGADAEGGDDTGS